MTAQPDTTELRALAEAAIPGPWEENVLGSEGYAVMGPPRPGDRLNRRRWVARVGMNDWQVDKDTAAFIAAANPTTVLALLDELDTLRAQVAAVMALADEWDDGETPWEPGRVEARRLRSALDTATQKAGDGDV